MRQFSKDEINAICDRLKQLGVMDSDFDSASVILDDDFVAIVQYGLNKLTTVKQLKQLFFDNAKAYIDDGDRKTLESGKAYVDGKTYSFSDIQGKIRADTQIEGIIPLENIPAGAMERLVVVKNDDARFALTKSDIQKGDTVKVESTDTMYFVVDDEKLGSEDGYQIYGGGEAANKALAAASKAEASAVNADRSAEAANTAKSNVESTDRTVNANEDVRIENENNRITAENNRVAEFSVLKKDSQDASAAANKAAQDCIDVFTLLSESQYQELEKKDNNKLYLIYEDDAEAEL